MMVNLPLHGQEVYLRLTDYGGGKIALIVRPFTSKEIDFNFLTKIKNIEVIVKNDLDYSLFFDIYTDSVPGEVYDQAINIKGEGQNNTLTITLEDIASSETIAMNDYVLEGELRQTAHAIADAIIEILTGEQGISSTRIVFSYRTGSGKELAMIDYDGYNFTGLTKNGKYNLFPAWAPDGRRVLFSTYATDRLNIYVFDLAARKIDAISSFRGLNFAPCWSPDASRIALSLTKDGNAEIYLLDLSTKKLNRITYNKAIDTSPAFSPNSREIAFVSDRTGNPQVYVMDIYGGNVRRLTYHGNYNTSPAWSPRGDLVAYVSRQDDNSQQIFVTDPYDFAPVQLTFVGNNEEPSWSPDGLHIVFSSSRSGTYELYTMNWDGSRKRKLTSGITAHAPDWSPIAK
ncbi:PD40 domain-containing protein [candidate division WOR-3 bacterium]|nr:PD40 domain-containing protein [candidate division WOR-3 bacterium]